VVGLSDGLDLADCLATVEPSARAEWLANLLADSEASSEEASMERVSPSDNRATAQPPEGEPEEPDPEAAWLKCASLATERNILDRLVADLAGCGLVGEDKAAMLVYLAVVSRLLDRPVSAAVKGPSSGGKSYMVETVLRFFPEGAFHALTGGSERALVYSEEPLKHRTLVVYEAAGISGDLPSYFLRSLISEGCLRYETVESTKDGLKPKLIEREGPTGLIVTTTAVRLHPENETRLLSIPVNDTRDQTARVLLSLADEDDQEAPDLTPWLALQDWLQAGQCVVTIPYSRRLANEIPPGCGPVA